jgi:hypothetical protein
VQRLPATFESAIARSSWRSDCAAVGILGAVYANTRIDHRRHRALADLDTELGSDR